jgi:hypothetical protein
VFDKKDNRVSIKVTPALLEALKDAQNQHRKETGKEPTYSDLLESAWKMVHPESGVVQIPPIQERLGPLIVEWFFSPIREPGEGMFKEGVAQTLGAEYLKIVKEQQEEFLALRTRKRETTA